MILINPGGSGLGWVWTGLLMEDFRVAHFACPHSTDPSDTRWVPPSNLWFKVNTNAAIFKNLGTVGIGTVIRDHAGTVIATLSQHLHLPLGPLEAKANAMDVAVSFAWDVGVQEVIFETDSHVIFTTLSGSNIPPATMIDVLESLQQKLHEFRRVKVQHVRRQRNKSAHALAQHAKGIHGFVTWLEESPPIIESLVLQDAMYLT